MNIVLIGFKSSGKSTVGAMLAKHAGMTFTDTDSVLETLFFEETGVQRGCRDIYAEKGAEYMRALETKTLGMLAETEETVLATGGGVVLCPENIPLLQKIGIRVFLDVPLAVLETRLAGSDSPLFARKSMADVYAERYPLYKNAADLLYAVEPEHTPVQLAEKIYEKIVGEKYGQ